MHYLLLLLLLPIIVLASQSIVAAPMADAPVVFSQTARNMSLDKAYQLQKAFVRNQASYGNIMAGFKVELNHAAKQQQYGLNKPITGIIMRSAIEKNHTTIAYRPDGLMVKVGFVYQAASAIKKPVKSLEQLKKYFPHVSPAVELPLFNFVDEQFNGLDIVANNAMAYKILVLDSEKEPADIDKAPHKLTCQDEVLFQAFDSSLGRGQWETLLWMVNHLISQGYGIRAGHILFTGGFQEMLVAQPCAYTADFGKLGQIYFTVK